MALANVVAEVLGTAAELKSANAANEANTKHHVIEPVLSALGWNLNDFSEVDREHKVFDGTFLDYALLINGAPKLFVEAKALGKSLADKQFIAQTVNYANNEGVLWCVLTNGLVYQVYKSNEAVPMERKLLFEVDLAEAAKDGELVQAIQSLEGLGRSAVEAGQLDAWGETVFTDLRVRSALSKLATAPKGVFLQAVTAAIEGPPVDPDVVRASLGRILGGTSGAASTGAVVGAAPPKSKPEKTTTPEPVGKTKTSYTIDHHIAKKPAAIVDLFEKVNAYAMALGPDVTQRPAKLYIGYYAGKKSFFTTELQKAKIWVYISLPPSDVKPWVDTEMRDVTKIGHYGMGDTEFMLHSREQLPRLEALLRASYLRNRK